MKQTTNKNLKGAGLATYLAPEIVSTAVEIESGFAVTNQSFYDSQDGVTNEDYVWGGSLDGEFE